MFIRAHFVSTAVVGLANHEIETFFVGVVSGAIVTGRGIVGISFDGARFDLAITIVDEEKFVDGSDVENFVGLITSSDAVIIKVVNHESDLALVFFSQASSTVGWRLMKAGGWLAGGLSSGLLSGDCDELALPVCETSADGSLERFGVKRGLAIRKTRVNVVIMATTDMLAMVIASGPWALMDLAKAATFSLELGEL